MRYAVSDLHGCFNLYEKINSILTLEDEVICLGDCNDRGSQGWELIKAVYNNPQWTYLMGNHEHLLFHAIATYFEHVEHKEIFIHGEENPYQDDPIDLLFYNGGRKTWSGWLSDGADEIWASNLSGLPTVMSMQNKRGNNIYLTHAGFTIPVVSNNSFDMTWNRKHILDKWIQDPFYQNSYIIHGHTPCSYIKKNYDISQGALKYCDGHKICIDASSYKSNKCILFNIDDFTSTVISG